MGTVAFYLSKILRPLLTSPLPLCLFMSLWALMLLKPFSPFQTWLRRIGILVILGTAVLSLPLVARILSQWYEVKRTQIDEIISRGPYGAILVLGGTVDPIASASGHVEGNDSFERLTAAAALYRAGAAPLVIASGGSNSLTAPHQKEAPYMAELLELMGVPKKAIIIEAMSRNTHENILYSKRIIETAVPLPQKDRPVILVSSAWHLKRALAVCRTQGLAVEPVSVDSQAEPLLLPADLVPDPWALYRCTRLIREWLGFFYYRLLGRL